MGIKDTEPTLELPPAVAARLERQLEAAQQLTHIGSWEWDLASGAVTWSDELYRIYGLVPRSAPITLEGFVGRVHPDDRERVQREIAAALERGGRFAHLERIVRDDGSVRELETVGEVVNDRHGRPVGLIGTCRDITEERRREEAIQLYADVVDHVQLGLSVWRLDSIGDPRTLRLVAFNRATESATGRPLAGMIGKTLPVVFPSAMATELPALLATVAGNGARRELPAFCFDTGPYAATFAVKAFALPDHGVGLALEDVTERNAAQRLQTAERRALELLASGASLADIFTVLIQAIEELTPGAMASILLLDDTGTRLAGGAAPSLPEAYNRALVGLSIGPKAGSCGTAAFRREPVVVADIEHDPLWEDYAELARPYGLRACWSTPILATDGRVLGTFAIYHREVQAPDPRGLELIGRATHIAGIAIERRQLDDQLRALTGRIEAVREDERTAIARDIHDQLGQALTALKMDIAWLGRRRHDPEAMAGKLAEMSQAADEIIHSVRRISAELRPGILDDLGLQAAIEWQADEFSGRIGIPAQVRSDVGDLVLERDLATAVFRIFQEALTNVARHASATRVEVSLGLAHGRLRLEITDDGVGMPVLARARDSLGLLGMRERARRLGGELKLERRVPHGTTVSVEVPLRFPPDRRTDTDSEIGG